MRISDWSSDVRSSDLVEEGDAAAQLGQAGQAAVDLGRGQVVQHVAAHQQVDRRTRPQLREVGEAREVQVAVAAVAGDRVLAAVEAQVLRARPQLQQRRAPRALAAADRSEEHTSELPALMRNSYAVF